MISNWRAAPIVNTQLGVSLHNRNGCVQYTCQSCTNIFMQRSALMFLAMLLVPYHTQCPKLIQIRHRKTWSILTPYCKLPLAYQTLAWNQFSRHIVWKLTKDVAEANWSMCVLIHVHVCWDKKLVNYHSCNFITNNNIHCLHKNI